MFGADALEVAHSPCTHQYTPGEVGRQGSLAVDADMHPDNSAGVD